MTLLPSPLSSTQSGNVLVIVLIAIALLAALTMTVMRSDVTDADSVSPEQAKIIASQVAAQARTLEQAVSTLITKGCSEQDISFENDVVTGYANAAAPADDTCHVFKRAGAGLSWPTPPTNANDGSAWRMIAGDAVDEVSRTDNNACVSGCIDLIAFLPNVSANVCRQINKLAGITPVNAYPHDFPVEPDNFNATTKIAGFDATAPGELLNSDNGELQRRKTGCFEATNVDGVPANGTYWFYHVLLVR